jgi:hypothetical protein
MYKINTKVVSQWKEFKNFVRVLLTLGFHGSSHVDSVLALLHCVDVGNDVDVSEVPVASIFNVELYRLMSVCVYMSKALCFKSNGGGGKGDSTGQKRHQSQLYPHIHMVQQPENRISNDIRVHPVLNKALRHERRLGEWLYSSTHY